MPKRLPQWTKGVNELVVSLKALDVQDVVVSAEGQVVSVDFTVGGKTPEELKTLADKVNALIHQGK